MLRVWVEPPALCRPPRGHLCLKAVQQLGLMPNNPAASSPYASQHTSVRRRAVLPPARAAATHHLPDSAAAMASSPI